jgi:hypothetical protein
LSATILNGDGRFVLLSEPAAHPFSDIVTGTPEGPVFDLSVDLEYYTGVAYVKAEHVIEMAKTLGMSTIEETKEMREHIATLEARENQLPAHVESLINGINNSVINFRNFPDLVGISAPVYLLDHPEKDDSGEGTGEGEPTEDSGKLEASGTDSANVKDNKPAVSKGSSKLPASTDDGFGFS